MPRHTRYAYVDGFDLEAVAAEIEERCDAFVPERHWRWRTPRVVNQRLEIDERHTSNDLPEWELGINIDLPDPGAESPGWFSDVEAIATFLGTLHSRTGRDFVIGIADREHGYTEDLFAVQSEHPDLEQLRHLFGVENLRLTLHCIRAGRWDFLGNARYHHHFHELIWPRTRPGLPAQASRTPSPHGAASSSVPTAGS
jgi:hypothetical protein